VTLSSSFQSLGCFDKLSHSSILALVSEVVLLSSTTGHLESSSISSLFSSSFISFSLLLSVAEIVIFLYTSGFFEIATMCFASSIASDARLSAKSLQGVLGFSTLTLSEPWPSSCPKERNSIVSKTFLLLISIFLDILFIISSLSPSFIFSSLLESDVILLIISSLHSSFICSSRAAKDAILLIKSSLFPKSTFSCISNLILSV